MKYFATFLLCLTMALSGRSQTARLQVIHNSPSPTVDIWAGTNPLLTNFEFRTASPYIDVPANVQIDIGIAPSPSTSPADIFATFPVTFDENKTYVVIASGIVGDLTTPFTLNVIEDARETATSSDVDFIVNHGSTDAPAVDVIARGVATLVTNAAYGDVTDYITVPAGEYILDITPTGQNDDIVASFNADLSGLGGGAAVIFASGFLSPLTVDDPAFGLWVSLPDGMTFPLDILSSTKEAVEIEGISVFPNPASDYLMLDLKLNEATDLEFSLVDLTGRLVVKQLTDRVNAGGYTERIGVEDVLPGYYFLTVKTASGTAVQKVMID